MAQRAGRKGVLSRDGILDAALGIVDDLGVDELTMRRVASELGVDPMALYRHVKNKDALLDGVLEILWRQVPLPVRGDGWSESLRTYARGLRDVIKAHPHAAHLLPGRSLFPRPALDAFHILLGNLRDAGFDDHRAARVVRSVTSVAMAEGVMVFGHPSFAQGDPNSWIAIAQALPPDTPADLVQAAHAICGEADSNADFDFILDLILHGAEHTHP